MTSSPLKIIQLSVLFIFIISAVSCGKDRDLMAEYVVSASLSPDDLAMLSMDDLEGTDTNGTSNSDTFLEESRSASVPQGTVEIDDVTNTLIYTPAAQNRSAAIKVPTTLTK